MAKKIRVGLGTMLGGLLAASMLGPNEAPELLPEKTFCSGCGKLGIEFRCQYKNLLTCDEGLCKGCAVKTKEGIYICPKHIKK